MISKDFSAPTGSGMRKLLVAPEALAAVAGTDRRITVIAAAMVAARVNWSEALPNATFLTVHAWMRRADDADTDLIIVDELAAPQRSLIIATLERIKTEVWTVNHDVHHAPLTNIESVTKERDWRPHAWITGGAGSGTSKAMIMRPTKDRQTTE